MATVDPTIPSRTGGHLIPALLALLLGASHAMGADVLPPPGPTPDAALRPVNLQTQLILFRHKATSPVTTESLAACQSVDDVLRVLRPAGTLNVIAYETREAACQPTGQIRFDALESRRVFAPGMAAPTNHEYGLRLEADFRLLSASDPGQPVAVAVTWKGSWAGSVQLLSRWEAIAVRGFNMARTVPGITYTRVEPDEDGFVNTGGGMDLGGLFRRKKKTPPKGEEKGRAAQRSPAPAPAPAAPATPATPEEREPSYSSDASRQTLPFAGTAIVSNDQLILSRHPLANPGDGELIFVLVPKWATGAN